MSAAQLTRQLQWARRQKAFAWAKYYESINEQHAGAIVQYQALTTSADDVAVPVHIKTTLKEMATALKKQFECPVCMEMIPTDQLEITNCGHYYCKPCLAATKAHAQAAGKPKWECGICRRKHGFKPDEE
jgi:hypothetical protein